VKEMFNQDSQCLRLHPPPYFITLEYGLINKLIGKDVKEMFNLHLDIWLEWGYFNGTKFDKARDIVSRRQVLVAYAYETI
jgi:hypothetical protein